MGGKNQTQTNTSSQSYTPAGLSGLQDIWSRLQSVASQPYTPYNGQLAAPLSSAQESAVNNLTGPNYQNAVNYAQSGAQAIDPSQISRYLNPYNQSVINATQAQFNNQNASQQQQVLSNAALQGALGGDRVGVAQAQLANQQQLAQAPVIAGLNSQNYSQALAAAQADRAAQAQGATNLSNVGTQGALAQLGAGNVQQQTQQNALNAAYQQFLTGQAFPYQQAQFLTSLGVPTLGSLGGTTSGTSVTSAPGPSPWGQAAGLGLTALGLFAKDGGRIKSYASGGITSGSPYDADVVVGYIPKVGAVQAASRPQISGMPVPNMLQGNSNPLAGMPSAGTIKGAAGGIRNLFGSSGVLDDPLAGAGLSASLENPSMFARGGVAGHDFISNVHAIHGALKSHKYAGGGLVDVLAPTQAGEGIGSVATPFDIASAAPAIPAAQAAPPLSPPTTIAAMPVANVPQTAAPAAAPSYGDRYARAVSTVESSGDYGAIGPETRTGDHAYGKYGVMGANIPEWTQSVLGRPMTPKEFLANPRAQDAVFKAQFGTYVDKYGPEGAAKAWFAGERGMSDPNARDVLGTTVSGYADKFKRALGFAPEPAANPLANITTDIPEKEAPSLFAQSPGGSFLTNLLSGKQSGLSDSARQGLMAAGLGMLASRSPFALTQIGEGGLQGVNAYAQARKLEQEKGQTQQRIDLQAKQLAQQAENFAKEFGLKQKQFDITAMQPVKVGTDVMGRDIYAQRDPKSGQYINLQTGKPITESPGMSPFLRPETPAAPNAPGVPQVSTQKTDEAAIPPNATPTSGENPNVRPDILAKLDPQIASQVKAISEGRMQFPSGFALRSPYWQTMLSLVTQYDPSFDAVNYGARSKARNDFTSGKSAQNITSFNTAIGHLDTLDKSIEALNNTNYPWWNKAANWAAVHGGSTRFQNAQKDFNIAKQAVIDELTRSFRGTGGNVHDLVEWEKSINDADSPSSLHTAVRRAIDLLHSRIESVGDQYNRGMGTTKDPLKLLSPKAEAALRRIEGTEKPSSPTSANSTAPTVSSRAEFDRLPSGAEFIGSDGKHYRKP